MPTKHSFSDKIRRFWPTFSWLENAWIVNHEGRHLGQKEHAYFQKCAISQLDIKRHSSLEFSCAPPIRTDGWISTHMRRWVRAFLSIVVCGLELQIGESEYVHQRHKLWVDEGLDNVYIWVLEEHGGATGSDAHGTSRIKMKRWTDGVLWDVVEWSAGTSVAADAEELQRRVESEGVTFLPHPLSTAIPWMVLQDLPAEVDKLELVGTKHEWTQHMQLRVPKEIWYQNNCVTMFQMWMGYRDATLQLNLFHPGRVTDTSCPVNAACGNAKETIPHIMWGCNRARATWKRVFERWTGQQAEDEHLRLLLPWIASRVPPSTTKSIQARINSRFGFFTSDHVIALRTIWFILSTTIPSVLWRQRNAMVHEHTEVSVDECSERAWRACSRQIQAAARERNSMRGQRFVGLSTRQCLQVLDQPDSPLEPPGWNHARLYFDGGARGNPGPGPGGGGWALVTQDSHTNEWVLTACGYAYKGTSVTNNYCEYAALQDGLAQARTELEHTATVTGRCTLSCAAAT